MLFSFQRELLTSTPWAYKPLQWFKKELRSLLKQHPAKQLEPGLKSELQVPGSSPRATAGRVNSQLRKKGARELYRLQVAGRDGCYFFLFVGLRRLQVRMFTLGQALLHHVFARHGGAPSLPVTEGDLTQR